jgi:hypothetical protein
MRFISEENAVKFWTTQLVEYEVLVVVAQNRRRLEIYHPHGKVVDLDDIDLDDQLWVLVEKENEWYVTTEVSNLDQKRKLKSIIWDRAMAQIKE